MDDTIASAWFSLENLSVSGGELGAKLFKPKVSNKVYIALDAMKRRHILVKLRPDEDSYAERPSKGLDITTQTYVLPQETSSRYVDIICLDPNGKDAFELIANDLALQINTSQTQSAETVRKVIAKWRRFWGRMPSSLLSMEAQLGLFAELWFLNKWLIPKIGQLRAVEFWRGPLGSRHDFEKPKASVEVKGTTSEPAIYHINGVRQLCPPEQGDLYLFGLRTRFEGGALATLPILVAECLQNLQSDSAASDLFDSALFEAGYSPEYDDEYAKSKYRICEEKLFYVRDNFPRLLPETFRDGIPSGIVDVGYGINLDNFGHLIAAASLNEFMQMEFIIE